MGEGTVKVEGGKMVNVKTDGSEVSVTGDFFIQPPEAREEVEEVLRSTEAEDIADRLEDIDADLIGFSSEDVEKAYRKAVEDES